MKRWGTIAYFAIAALIFLGFIYLGVTREFSNSLDAGFLIVLWCFVVIAMKTGLVKVAPGTGLPLTNLRVKFKVPSLLWAIACAVLAVLWSAIAGHLLYRIPLNDTWIGVAFAFGPALLLLALMVKFIMAGFKLTRGRR